MMMATYTNWENERKAMIKHLMRCKAKSASKKRINDLHGPCSGQISKWQKRVHTNHGYVITTFGFRKICSSKFIHLLEPKSKKNKRPRTEWCPRGRFYVSTHFLYKVMIRKDKRKGFMFLPLNFRHYIFGDDVNIEKFVTKSFFSHKCPPPSRF